MATSRPGRRRRMRVTLPVFVVASDALAADSVTLDGDEGRHAAVVKRIRVGEHLVLTDGRGAGSRVRGHVGVEGALVADVRRTPLDEPAPQPRLVVVQAIPKGDHAERAVDLLTEVGADVIVPWAAERNVVTWKGDRGAKALSRWRSTAQAAAKQSRRLWFPEVLDLHTTRRMSLVWCEQRCCGVRAARDRRRHPRQSPGARSRRRGACRRTRGRDHRRRADAPGVAGAAAVRLGPAVLRSSSAGLAAAARSCSPHPPLVTDHHPVVELVETR